MIENQFESGSISLQAMRSAPLTAAGARPLQSRYGSKARKLPDWLLLRLALFGKAYLAVSDQLSLVHDVLTS